MMEEWGPLSGIYGVLVSIVVEDKGGLETDEDVCAEGLQGKPL